MGRALFILIGFFILIAILFFPIILTTSAHYDMNRRKFGFCIYGYNFIKLLGGYIATYPGGLALHVSDEKAILIPYSELESERKRFSFVQSFQLKSLSLTTETGAEYLFPVAIGHMLMRGFFFAIGGGRKNIKNNLWLTDGDELRIGFHCTLFFNLFMLLCNFFKFIKEKIKIIWLKNIKKSTT